MTCWFSRYVALPERKLIFQPSIFRCELAVSFGVGKGSTQGTYPQTSRPQKWTTSRTAGHVDKPRGKGVVNGFGQLHPRSQGIRTLGAAEPKPIKKKDWLAKQRASPNKHILYSFFCGRFGMFFSDQERWDDMN